MRGGTGNAEPRGFFLRALRKRPYEWPFRPGVASFGVHGNGPASGAIGDGDEVRPSCSRRRSCAQERAPIKRNLDTNVRVRFRGGEPRACRRVAEDLQSQGLLTPF